jgi:AraC-like DNA-binding protein
MRGGNKYAMNPYSKHTIQRIREAVTQLTVDLSQRITIRQLSRKTCMNSRTLQDCFKSVYGKTIFDYIQDLRMAQAKELLKTTDLNLQKIAELCGYRESSNFSFAFKKMEGVGPGLWRSGSGASCGGAVETRIWRRGSGTGCGGTVGTKLWRRGK